MLQKIHEKVQGLIAWVMVSFVTITFVLWGINYYIDSHNHDSANTVAEVNGSIIDQNTFHNTFERAKRSEQARLGDKFNYTNAFEQQLKQQTLKMLVLNQVLLQAAAKAGYLISIQQAEMAMMQIPQFLDQGQFSEAKFQQVISEALYTPASFIQQMQQGMLINQQHFAFARTNFALPSDVDNLIKILNQTRDYSYIEIDSNKFKDQVSISENELQQYYQKNKENFKTTEQVSIQYITLSLNDIISKTNVSEEEIKSYYNENSGNYSKPAQWQLAHILIKVANNANSEQKDTAMRKAQEVIKQLHNGSKFANLVPKYSDDIISVKNKGLMPPLTAGTLSPEFDNAMLQLKKVGDFSNPISTKYGYEILSLVSYKEPQKIALDEVKNQIATLIKNDKAQKLFAQQNEDLANVAFQNPDSLQAAAQQLNLSIKESDLFPQQGLKSGIASHKKVIHAAFSDDVLIQKNNSQPVQIDDNSIVVLRVKQHIPQTTIPYNQMQSKIRQQLLEEKQQQLAKDYGNKLIQRLNSKKPVGDLLTQLKLEWHIQKNVKRQLNQNAPLINQLAFNLPQGHANSRPIVGKLIGRNFTIVRLDKVVDGSIAQVTKEQRLAYAHELENAFGAMEYELYIQGLMKRAKIVNHKV